MDRDPAATRVPPGSTTGRIGRPRSTAADDAILRAALDIIVEHGIHDASVDDIAARAHAGKDTIYRRWPHKEDLIRAALEHALDASLPMPATGWPANDVTSYLVSLDGMLTSGPSAALLRELVAEAVHDPLAAERLAAFRRRHVSAVATLIGTPGAGPSGGGRSDVAAVLVDWACGRRLMHGSEPDPPVGAVAWVVSLCLSSQAIERTGRPAG